MQNIHATVVDFNKSGILILGPSGAGKSDLALRLICDKGAILVSDDRTDLNLKDDALIASAPENLAGLIEVRGLGLVRLNFQKQTQIKLVLELCPREEIERMPSLSFFNYENVRIPLFKLDPFELSALDKIVVKLNCVLEQEK